MLLYLSFVACMAVIVYSGVKLSKYGDIIAEKTGIGRAWTGMVLMASVTSLPELVIGITSVTVSNAPDIAAGDVLGSCVFNMLILAFLDALTRPGPLSTKAHYGNVLSAGFGILLLSIVAAGIFLGGNLPSAGPVGIYSIVFAAVYPVSVRMTYNFEKRRIAAYLKETVEAKYADITLKTAAFGYLINALAVVAAAVFLPGIGKGIAEATGLGQTLVGSVFISVSTSLPEVVVSVSAVRMGAIDLAIGNLFGSNIFNVLILAVDDLFFTGGPFLSYVSPNHIISAVSAIAMTAIAIIGLTYRAEKKPFFLAWDSIFIVSVYLINIALLYALK